MELYDLVKKYNISKTLFLFYCACFSIIIYFLCCAFFGQRGLISYFETNHNFLKYNNIRHSLSNELDAKKKLVDGMNVESLDLDLLDEEARRTLGYSNKNEVVVPIEQKN